MVSGFDKKRVREGPWGTVTGVGYGPSTPAPDPTDVDNNLLGVRKRTRNFPIVLELWSSGPILRPRPRFSLGDSRLKE